MRDKTIVQMRELTNPSKAFEKLIYSNATKCDWKLEK